MDAKKNDGNEHEQKTSPLTSIPLFSRPHSVLFSQFIKGGGSIFMLALIEINLANNDSC